MWLRGAVLGALSVALLAGPAAACPLPVVYPGDGAPKEAIAQWMARRATDRAIPAELPVMGALVASGVKNINYGDADEVGYFQMRVGIWNQGAYAGFPDHPELQMNWFLDQAIGNRQSRIAAGRPDPAGDANLWGDWIADVLRPAEQYRGRYQLRLGEARELIGPACPGEAPPAVPLPPSGSAPVATTPDTTAPVARLSGARDQHALRRGAVLVAVTCPAEACTASAAGTVRVPRRAHALRLEAKPIALAQGQTLTLRLALSRAARAALRRSLRAHGRLVVKLRVTVADTIGNEATSSRTVRLRL